MTDHPDQTPPQDRGKAPRARERFDPDAGPRGDRPYPETGRPGGAQDDLEQPADQLEEEGR